MQGHQGSPYPRRHLLHWVRASMLYGWGPVIAYVVNAIANLYKLTHTQPSNNLSPYQIVLLLVQPVVFSDTSGSVNGWVIALIFLPLPFIFAAYVWAKQDQNQESEAAIKGVIVVTIREEMIAFDKRLTEQIPHKPDRVWGDLPRIGDLIGREGDLEQLKAWLKESQTVAVLAVHGQPSVGKTVLAAEAMGQLVDEGTFPGGAAWIPCDDLQGPEGLAQLWTRIARALSVGDASTLPGPAERRAALHADLSDPSRPRLLLALDNVERGLDMKTVLDTISGGRTTVLLTSRYDVVSEIVSERVQRLPLEPLSESAARLLFVRRLQQAAPGRPTPDESQAIDALIPMLGGLPLAIQLVAYHAGLQGRPLDKVAEEIRRDRLHADPLRGLSTEFDRSWKSLTSSQQYLFAGLSDLVGPSFPRDAALAVAQAALVLTYGHRLPDVQDARGDLATLIGSSLLQPLAQDRLRLHPLLRDFAEGRLDEMPNRISLPLGSAILLYWHQFVRDHSSNVQDVNALEAEASGLIGALQWAYEHNRREDLLELVRIVEDIWDVRGRHEELRQMLEWAIRVAEALHNESAICEMTLKLAQLQSKMGQPQLAYTNYETAEMLARQLSDASARVAALLGLAVGERGRARRPRARDHLATALDLVTEQTHSLSDERAIYHELALIAFDEEEFAEALRHFDAALNVAQRLPDSDADAIVQEQRWIARLKSEHPDIEL